MLALATGKAHWHKVLAAVVLVLWSTPGALAQTAASITSKTELKAELTLQYGHSGYVTSIDFSPDGKWLASGSADGLVKLWDARTGAAVRTLTTMTHQQWIFGVRFSPDGTILASSHGDLWDVRSGRLLRTLPGDSMSIGFSEDGKIVAVNSSLYDAASGKLLRNLSGPTGDGERKFLQFFEVAFSPDGKTLAGAVTDRTLRLWDVQTGALLKTLQRNLYVKAVVYTTDGKFVIGACGDNTLKIWDTASGEVVRTISGHTREVSSVVYSRDRKLLASGSEDGTIRLWEVDEAGLPAQNPIRIFDRVTNVTEVAIAPDHKTIAATSPFDIVWWDMETGAMKQRQRTFQSQVHSLAFAPGGSTLIVGSGDRAISFWNMEQGDLVWTLIGDREEVYGPITHLAPAADGKTLTSVANGQIATWELRKLKLLRKFKAVGITAVAHSPDGRLLAEYSKKAANINLWDMVTGEIVRTVATDAATIQALAFSADGQTLAGAHEYTLRFWNLETGQERQAINLKDQWMKALAFSPDGTVLAAARGNGTVSLFDIQTGEIRKDLKSPLPYTDVRELAFSPDGKQVVASNHNRFGPAVLWNIETAASQELLPVSISGIKAVAFSPNGKTIVGGTGDGFIRVWSSANGKLLITLAQVPSEEIRDIRDGRWADVVPNSWVAFTPEGYYNAAPGAERYIRWNVGDDVFPASKYAATYHRPDKVQAALSDQQP